MSDDQRRSRTTQAHPGARHAVRVLGSFTLVSDGAAVPLGVDARKARMTAYAIAGFFTASAGLATTAYTGGAVVSYNGHKWTAKWWTQGDTPGNNSQGVWTDNGAC